MREKKEDLNKFRNLLCSQYRGQFSPQWYTDLIQFLSESQQDFLHIEQDYSKIYIEKETNQNSKKKKKKKILKNKDKVEGICSLNFNIYIAARWGTTKRTDIKINRMEENPELDPQKYPKWVSTKMQKQFNGGISIVLKQLNIHRQTNEPLPKYYT